MSRSCVGGNSMEQSPVTIEITISEDKMSAYLKLISDHSDVSVPLEQIKEALSSHGIVYGINEEAIRELCDNPQRFLKEAVEIAKGTPPVPGEDGRIEYMFNGDASHTVKPKELEDGRVDYYNVMQIANVSRGQLLAQKIPPVQGEAGTTVTGQKIPPKVGREVAIKPGKNVVLNEDKSLLYATLDGQVSITDKDKINVFPVYEVKGDVDFSVGNIDFVGTVVVQGNVPTGFSIKASGDIRILGSVEGAELEAGGSIEIRNGIAAQDKGHVIAGTDVITSYIQNGNITAGNDVVVSQSIMFSNVKAGRNVICTKTKGIIIGGLIQAGEKIEARVIGNASATQTNLEVGVRPDLRNELMDIIRQLHDLTDNLRKTQQGLQVLDQLLAKAGSLPPEKKMIQIKLTSTYIGLEKQIKELESRKMELETEIETISHASVIVHNIMFPGVKMVFGKYTRYIKQEFSRTRFILDRSEIVTSPFI